LNSSRRLAAAAAMAAHQVPAAALGAPSAPRASTAVHAMTTTNAPTVVAVGSVGRGVTGAGRSTAARHVHSTVTAEDVQPTSAPAVPAVSAAATRSPAKQPSSSQLRGSRRSPAMVVTVAAVPRTTNALPSWSSRGSSSHSGPAPAALPVRASTVSVTATTPSTAARPFTESFGSAIWVLVRFHRTRGP
jgi:hypothetical protein